MSGLLDCIDEAAAQIRAALESEVYGIQVESGMVLNPTPPTIDVYPGDPARDRQSAAFDDVDGGYVFTVRARVNTADESTGQRLLLELMDDESDLCIAVALLDDPTLNGHASSIDIRDVSGYRLYEHPSGEGAYLGFQFTLLVLAAKS